MAAITWTSIEGPCVKMGLMGLYLPRLGHAGDEFYAWVYRQPICL